MLNKVDPVACYVSVSSYHSDLENDRPYRENQESGCIYFNERNSFIPFVKHGE